MKKEIPILFSTPMVQAILEGRKTMTRRIVKPQPDDDGLWNHDKFPMSLDSELSGWWGTVDATGESKEFRCPYGWGGKPYLNSAALWVREEHYRFGQWVEKEGVFTKTGKQKWQFIAHTDEVRYHDNPPADFRKGMHNKDPHHVGWYKRLARFMPKTSCRIWLQVTDVKVEQLHDITQTDAVAEGIEHIADNGYKSYEVEGAGFYGYFKASRSFRSLWIKINGLESWNANPWVWVVSFKLLSTTGRPAALTTNHQPQTTN